MRSTFKVCILLLLSLLLIVSFVLATVIYSVNSTILKPYSLNGYFEGSGAYPTLAEYIAANIAPTSDTAAPEEEQMLREAAAKATANVVTADWLEAKFVLLEASIWDYMLGKKERLANIPIPELREALVNEFQHALDSMQATEDERRALHAQFQAKIPHVIDLYDTYKVKEEDLQRFKRGYEQAKKGIVLLWLLLATFILSGTIVTFYPKWLFRWLGYVAVCISVLLGLSYLGIQWSNPRSLVERLWADRLGEWYEVASHIVGQATDHMLSIKVTIAIAALVFGILALIASHMNWMERWNSMIRTQLAASRWHLLVRGVSLVVIIGAFSAAVHHFYNSFMG